jgi:nitroreductase
VDTTGNRTAGRNRTGPAVDVFDAMRRRRMHRQFTPEPVSREILERLVYAAGRAQAVRADIRHIVVVTDPRIVRTLRQVCPGLIANAPSVIVVCSDLDRAEALVGTRGVEHVVRLDAGAAAGYMALAAPALGIGVCIVTSWNETGVQAVLDLPPHVRPEVIVAVGNPIPNPARAVRRFEPVVHENRYGSAWEP